MRQRILIGLGVVATLILLFVIVVATRPSEFRISRSTAIAAPPEIVFEQVNNLRNWDGWSPWAKLDPNAKHSFDGPEEGEGAAFLWSGNDKIGEGDMKIVESEPPKLVRMKLHFVRPMEDTCDTEFTFQPQGKETKITWTMSGKQNFVGKAICMFMNMDKMVGDQFNEGLGSMKQIAEAKAKAASAEESEKSEPVAASES